MVVVAGVKLTVNLSRHELSRISYKAQAGLDNTLKVSKYIVRSTGCKSCTLQTLEMYGNNQDGISI